MSVPKLRFPEFLDAGEWEEKKLGEVLTIGNGKDYKHLSKGDVPVYGTGGYMLSVDDYLYDGESVCIGRKGTIDKPVLLSGKFWTVDTLFYTHSFRNCLPKFIYLCFQCINWLDYNAASGVPSLSKSTIENIALAIPSLPEQQKIADCLTSLADRITLEAQKLDTLKAHKKGLMQQLFPAEGETLPKLRFPEFQDSGEWEEKKLEDISSFINQKVPLEQVSLFNYISTENLLPDYGGVVTASKLPPTGSATQFLKNDILISNIRPYLKKVWLADKDGAASNDVIVIRSKTGVINQCLAFLLKNDKFIDYVMEGAKGVKMPRGDISLIKQYPLALPPIPEQQKIADCLTSIDEAIAAQSQAIELLKLHKKGLMQQLFPSVEEVKG
jgi:type I restriction enzyme S subunit